MSTNPWLKRSFVLIAALCCFGGFLIGSSWGQGQPAAAAGAEGRYQLLVSGDGLYTIFDTRTARGWTFFAVIGGPGRHSHPVVEGEWKEISSPFGKPRDNP